MTWNHPLTGGNKKTVWACLAMFLDLNGIGWQPSPPDLDEAEATVLAIAARDLGESQGPTRFALTLPRRLVAATGG